MRRRWPLNFHRDGDYTNDTDPFPLLQAADATSCGMRCAPYCEGSVVVDASRGRGDCAVFGSRCVNDALGARCAFFACPDRGEVDVCVDRSAGVDVSPETSDAVSYGGAGAGHPYAAARREPPVAALTLSQVAP